MTVKHVEQEKNKNERRLPVVYYLVVFSAATVLVLIEILLYFLYINPSVKSKAERDIIYYTEEINKNPDNPESYIALAQAYFKLKDDDRGIYYLKKGLQEFPDDSRFLLLLAEYFFKKKNYSTAEDYCEAGIKSFPDNPGFYVLLGEINLKRNKKALSAYYFSEALKRDPYNADIMIRLAEIFEKKGNYDEALKLYRRALEFVPNLPQAKEGIERIRSRKNEQKN